MEVIVHTADRQSGCLVGPGNAAEIWPKTALDLRAQDRPTILRAPNTMVKTIGERVHYVYGSAVPAGLGRFMRLNPPLKRWAIFFRPDGLAIGAPESSKKIKVSLRK